MQHGSLSMHKYGFWVTRIADNHFGCCPYFFLFSSTSFYQCTSYHPIWSSWASYWVLCTSTRSTWCCMTSIILTKTETSWLTWRPPSSHWVSDQYSSKRNLRSVTYFLKICVPVLQRMHFPSNYIHVQLGPNVYRHLWSKCKLQWRIWGGGGAQGTPPPPPPPPKKKKKKKKKMDWLCDFL